jgi:hypothetical protein
MAVKFNQSFNVNRLIKKLIYLVVGLLVGGLILSAFIDAFRGYCSVFFNGLNILGVNITTSSTYGSQTQADVANVTLQSSCTESNYIIGSSGNLNTGILTVVGIIGVAGILMTEFVSW